MGGNSLGALISQLLSGQARNWPAQLRPDALLLIMHCAKIEDALIHGSIARLFGARDVATPFASGLELLDRWQVPAGNRFIWPQGHFSLPIALTRNDAPLRRFRRVVETLS